MIAHAAEIWITLFAIFVVGSVVGWLIYRLVDRSDYAFDQRELSDAVGRRLLGHDPLDLTEDDLPPPGQLRLPPPRKSRAAEKLRKKVRSSARAAAWTEARDPNAAEAVVEERAKPTEKVEVSGPAAKQKTAPTGPRQAPNPSPRATPRRAAAPSHDHDSDDPWPSPIETWPIRKPVWPSVKGPPQLPAAGKSAALPVLSQGPAQDEIWPKSSEPTRAARPPVVEKAPPAPAVETNVTLDDDDWPFDEGPTKDRVFVRKTDPSGAPRRADADVEEAATMLSPEDPDKDRPPGLSEPPARRDNLKRIKGIGPAFERRLHGIGVYQFHQIASWTPAERDWVSQTLGATGRIENDDWIGQAVELITAKSR